MNAAGQVAVNSAPYVAGHCFFNALENALRYRQPTKVLQLGAGGDSDWRKRYKRTDGGSYDVNSAFSLKHVPLSNSGARLVDWSRRYDVLELSKVRRQVAVVQRAAAFLHGEPGGLFHIYAMMVAAHGGAPGGPTVAELRRAPTMRTHATCTSLNISKYYHQRSIMNAAIDLSTPAMSLWWYVNNSDMTAAVLALRPAPANRCPLPPR